MFGSGAKRRAAGRGSGTLSFIGREVAVTGDIATSGELHIDGQVTGDIACGSLGQGESGTVRGNITAGHIRIAGLVDGNVEASELFLEPTARVTGDVLYGSISIAAGAQIEGRLRRLKKAAEAPCGATGPMRPGAAALAGELFPQNDTAEAAE